MYCTSCGINNEDGAEFCVNCGAKLEQSVTIAPVAETPTAADLLVESPEGGQQGDTAQTAQPVPPPAPIYMPPTYNAVIGTIKQMGSSGKFLAMAILYSAVAGLSVFSSLISGFIIPTVYSLSPNYGEELAESFAGSFSSFPSVTTILIIIGLWLTYAACKKPENAVKTGGLVVLKVASIIELVRVCIWEALACIVLIAFNVIPELKALLNELNDEFNPIGASINITQILTLAGAVLVAILAFAIFYCVKKLQTVNAVLDSVKIGIPSQKASSFFGVMQYISGALLTVFGLAVIVGGFAVALMFKDYVSPSTFELVMIVMAAVMFANAAYNFILGSLVFEFRSEMQNIKNVSDTAFIQD